MNTLWRCALLACLFSGIQLNLAAKDVPLAAGNLLQCTLDEPNLSSRTLKVGDPIVCYARPEEVFGCSLFPRGTQLAGRFAEYKNPGRLRGEGWIRLEFDRLILPNGIAPISSRVISVRGFKVDAEGRILGQGALKRERLITLRLLDDVRLPCAGSGLVPLESERGSLKDFAWPLSGRSELEPFDSFGSIIRFDSASQSEARSTPSHNSSGSPARDTMGAAQSPSTD